MHHLPLPQHSFSQQHRLFRTSIGCDCSAKYFTEAIIVLGGGIAISGSWIPSKNTSSDAFFGQYGWMTQHIDIFLHFWSAFLIVSMIVWNFLDFLDECVCWLNCHCLYLNFYLYFYISDQYFLLRWWLFKKILAILDECVCGVCWLPELCVFCSTGEHYSYNHRGHLFHWIVTKQTMGIFAQASFF